MGQFRWYRRGRKLCLCAALMLALTGLGASAETSGAFEYARVEGGVEITGWSGEGTAIEVPDDIGGERVVSIGANAFAGSELAERITLPEGLTALGDRAFADCYSLEAIRVPASVAQVGVNPFAGCESLRRLELAEGQGALMTINGVLFGDGGSRLIFCPRTLPMERYVIPEGTRRVDARAFSYCNRLLSVTVPDSVTEIGPDAFEGRANLTLVVGRESCGEAYARANDIKYTYPDSDEWLSE